MNITAYLIVDGAGGVRVKKRGPYPLRVDEVAFRLNIIIPTIWGRIQQEPVSITMPDLPAWLKVTDTVVAPEEEP